MEAFNYSSIRANRIRKKPTNTHRSKQFFSISLIAFFFILLFCFSNKYTINSLFSNPLKTTRFPQCVKLNEVQPVKGQKFLWYTPHSGFSNQLSEFKNAVLMSAILNRTLIIPPVLDHHAVVLGSCPKFRVSDPKELRLAVWNHSIELIQSRRYVSMADIIGLSSLISDSAVEVIDFRNFISLFCDIDLNYFCIKSSRIEDSFLQKLSQCGSLLSGYNTDLNDCVYAVEEDCRTTVWTYQKDGEDGVLDSFQPDEQLKKKKKISFIRRRKDVFRALGPHSRAELATILSFGTLFTAPYKGSESYIDIHEAPKDKKIQSLITKIEFLPFVPEILDAGKSYARRRVTSSFLCAQLRLLDGQFKNHWRGTFEGLKQKVDALREREIFPVHIFVMTDLPLSNWSGTYLEDLANDPDSVKLYVLSEEDELIRKTAMKVVNGGHGGFFGKDCNMRPPDILFTCSRNCL